MTNIRLALFVDFNRLLWIVPDPLNKNFALFRCFITVTQCNNALWRTSVCMNEYLYKQIL